MAGRAAGRRGEGTAGAAELRGEPVSPSDDASPLLVLPEEGLVVSRDIRKASIYAGSVRNGIHTRGANGIFFLDVLERRGPMVRVRNDPRRGRNPTVPHVEAWIEEDAVRPLLRGENVGRGSANPGGYLLFFHDINHLSRPLPDAIAASRFPAAYEFAKKFESFLRDRHRFRNFDPTRDDWLGIYSVTQAAVAEHKVVFREIAQRMTAAAVHSASTVPDHKLYVSIRESVVSLVTHSGCLSIEHRQS
jgi:hypothetical protein